MWCSLPVLNVQWPFVEINPKKSWRFIVKRGLVLCLKKRFCVCFTTSRVDPPVGLCRSALISCPLLPSAGPMTWTAWSRWVGARFLHIVGGKNTQSIFLTWSLWERLNHKERDRSHFEQRGSVITVHYWDIRCVDCTISHSLQHNSCDNQFILHLQSYTHCDRRHLLSLMLISVWHSRHINKVMFRIDIQPRASFISPKMLSKIKRKS